LEDERKQTIVRRNSAKGDFMKMNYSGERISVEEAAKMLSMIKRTVQVLMQREKLPIGNALKVKDTYTYFIYKGRVEAYLKGFDMIIVDGSK